MIPNVELSANSTFDVDEIIDIVAQETTVEMVNALMNGVTEKLPYSQIASRHINVQFDTEFYNLDEKTKRIYGKLFSTTFEHIKNNSFSLQLMFERMNQPTIDSFLESFVLEGTKRAMGILKLKNPEALEKPEIWQ